MSRIIRGVLALVVGGVIFATCSLLVFVLSVATFGLARPYIVHAPMWTGKIMLAVVYRGILGIRCVVQRRNAHRKTSPTLVMANHPTLLTVMLFTAFAEELVGMPLVFVGKREHLRNPFVGWALAVSGIGVLIDRVDRNGAISTIRRSIARVTQRGCALAIFPDQSRPTKQFIAADQQKFAGKVPRLTSFRFTGVPRDGGVFASYGAMQNPCVIDFTTECSVPTARWRDIVGMVGSTYHLVVNDVTNDVPRDIERRREWLLGRWSQKNLIIEHWRE